MARFNNEKALSLLQVRTLQFLIRTETDSMPTRWAIAENAENVIRKAEDDFPEIFPETDENAYFAFTLSACAKEAIRRGELKVVEYISILASAKEENESSLNDYGAFGDLLEVLIRCAFKRKISLVRWSDLSVKAINSDDVNSRKFGIVEIGHNGKTFTFGTAYDHMAGDFTAVVYGVFDTEDKKTVYDLCKACKYEEALDFVTSYTVYWENKYTFENDMNSLTRGKGITVKRDGVQVVYNTGKRDAFLKALEDGKFISLYDTLNR